MSDVKNVSEKSLQSVLAPQITEKATMVADKFNQVAFKVAQNATKKDVKDAIEAMFKV
jgi:large subunit ribosomal protein L23